jgi:hypothetical protein
LPEEGSIGVVGKVLVREWGFFIAMLRFEPNATIHEHPGLNDTDARTQIRAGELVRWPKEVPHRLWTEGAQMTTLMFERIS